MERISRARIYFPEFSPLEFAMTRMSLGIEAPRSPTLSRHRSNSLGGTEDEFDGISLADALLQADDPGVVGIDYSLNSAKEKNEDLAVVEDAQVETDNQPDASAAPDDTVPDTPLGIYFRDIARIPLLTAEQEVDLAQKIERGELAKIELRENGDLDEAMRNALEAEAEIGAGARTTLMESNLRLVASVARRYLGRGLPLGDLIQEGSLGLSRAVEKFDYRRGFKFSTYSYWWIRQAVTRAIANQSRTIRVPVHMVDQIGHVYRKHQELQQKLGRDPKIKEVAAAMGMTEEKVREALRASANPISLETPVGSDEENTLGDLLSNKGQETPGEAAERTLLEEYLDDALEELTSRERMVLRMRFGLTDQRPRTLSEIGQVIGVSRERVRQLEEEALAKMRRPNLRLRLAEYLE